MTSELTRPIFIAGGGTGGHVYPALAIADALVSEGIVPAATDVHFVGSERGLEATAVPAAGYSITLFPGRGIAREVSMKSVKAALGLTVAFGKALRLLRERRPAAVVSVGGYAAAPASFAAVMLRVPVVIAESNAVPGAVNRALGRFAAASAVAWPGTHLPKATVTGNPVRSVVTQVERSLTARARAKEALGFSSSQPLVVATGGSLGARRINEAVASLAEIWPDELPASLLHIVGRRDFTNPGLQARSSGVLSVKAVEYQDAMEQVYEAADVMICRSGATTIAELTAAGVPSILVPLPNSPGDHQGANARLLQSAGAAVVLTDAECTETNLKDEVTALLIQPERLRSMEHAARQLAKPHAAQAVADVVRSVLAKQR